MSHSSAANLTPLDRSALERAGEILRDGGLVAFPTETVYGLGADARNDAAVARIYEAKGRPSFNPLIVHAPDIEGALRLGALPPAAQRLAEAFWPGPLTLVAPRRDQSLSLLVSAGLDTVALRVPADEPARDLIRLAGGAVAAPSANPSGRLSPTTAAAVAEGLGDAVDLILDGGPCVVGVESTILATEEGGVRLLREGGLAREEIEAVLGAPLLEDHRAAEADEARRAPGMLESHYAPGAALRLNAAAPAEEEAYLAFAAQAAEDRPSLTLSTTGDLREAAAKLFAHLRALDASLGGKGRIAVAPIPERGLGRAINDRLRRAAAPRPPNE